MERNLPALQKTPKMAHNSRLFGAFSVSHLFCIFMDCHFPGICQRYSPIRELFSNRAILGNVIGAWFYFLKILVKGV